MFTYKIKPDKMLVKKAYMIFSKNIISGGPGIALYNQNSKPIIFTIIKAIILIMKFFVLSVLIGINDNIIDCLFLLSAASTSINS